MTSYNFRHTNTTPKSFADNFRAQAQAKRMEARLLIARAEELEEVAWKIEQELSEADDQLEAP